jgi:hypothetical protein
MRILSVGTSIALIPKDKPMSRRQFAVFRVVYSGIALVWLGGLLLINLAWHGPTWAKVLFTLLFVLVTPDMAGPWRHQRYLEWWEKEHRVSASAGTTPPGRQA